MPAVIKPKKSETASSVPSTSDLVVGEICMNVADKKIYTRKSDNSIVVVSSHIDASSTSVGGDLTGTVSNAQIGSNTVTATELADNSVGIAELNVADGTNLQVLTTNGSGTLSWTSKTDATLGANSVGITELNVSDGNSGQMLSTNGSGTLSFADASIAANAVNGTHIALGSDAAGDVMYYNGTNYIRLAKGSNGEVLTLASGVPSWAADSTNVGGTSVGGAVTGTVSNIQIAADAITGAKIADNAIDSEHYTDGSIDLAHLAADSVDGTKIADNGINSEHYTDGSIDTAHIADDQVTYAKIQNVSATDRILGRDSASAGVIEEITPANLRTMLGVETGATADQSASEIKTLLEDGIDSVHYVDGSIDLAHLSADSVDGTKIVDDALDSEHYTNGSIDDAHIAGMAASKLTGTITPSDNTVTGAKIALGSDAAGDIMYYNGTNYIRLAKGSAAQLLTINSGATAPEWTTSSGATLQQATAKAVTMAIALG